MTPPPESESGFAPGEPAPGGRWRPIRTGESNSDNISKGPIPGGTESDLQAPPSQSFDPVQVGSLATLLSRLFGPIQGGGKPGGQQEDGLDTPVVHLERPGHKPGKPSPDNILLNFAPQGTKPASEVSLQDIDKPERE